MCRKAKAVATYCFDGEGAPALARHKSAFRRRFNGRWLRWKAWRGLFRVVPLAKYFSFPMKSATATDTAIETFESVRLLESGNFTSAQMDTVVLPALASDKIKVKSASPGCTHVRRESAILADCAILGHVGALIRGSDGALLYQRVGRVPNWNVTKPKRLRSRDMGDSLVTSLPFGVQYYHFFEKLLTLIDYLDRHHTPGTPLTVLVAAKTPAFQQSVFKAIESAFPEVTFAALLPDERAEIGRYVWLHEAPENAEWMPVTIARAARLGAIMRSAYSQREPTGGELMFFSRGSVKLRRLLNEAELEAMAARHGFQRFEAVSANHPEQVQRFGNADVIVAVHGAGLANLLFARPGTIVVELFPEDFVKSTYLWLSNRLGLRHIPVVGSRGSYDQDFRVDPAVFSARLDEAMALTARPLSSPLSPMQVSL